ncbi:MAG: hypothetical protein II165_07230 [Bacteroidales bacterium]|nr:hypothetical protein [Bacteroidales bacterium]
MEYTETYISESEIHRPKFHIGQSYKPDFGAWLSLRWLYSITATDGKVWQHVIFYLFFTLLLSPLALTLDLMGILIYGLFLLAKKFLEGLFAAVFAICQKAIGIAAMIAAAVGTILIIYFKWDVITDFIKGLFG